MRRRHWRGLLAAGLVIALACALLPQPAAADYYRVPGWAPPGQGSETPPPPGPSGTPAPATTPLPTTTPAPTSTTTIVENIFHVIRFPFETMTDAVVQMSNRIAIHAYRDAGSRFAGAMDRLVFGDYGLAPAAEAGAATPLFANLIWPHWQVTMALGLLLLPITLLLTAVSALRMGATSALGLVDLKEALLGWLIAAGAAGASYYLLSLAHRLTTAAALSILRSDMGEQVTGDTLAGAFFNVKALLAASGSLLTAPIVLYIAFFALFLASSVMLGLGLALAAYIALVYLLTTLAPVVLMLATLPPLRWLQGLWLKAVTITFLVPVIDALLIKAAISLFYGLLNAQGSGDLGTFLSGVFVTAGVISVLITINFKVGEMVFGALVEVHRRAWDATTGVAQLAVLAGGFALGGLAVGAAGAGAGGVSIPGAASSGASSATAGGAAVASGGSGAASQSGAAAGPASRAGSIAGRLAGLAGHSAPSAHTTQSAPDTNPAPGAAESQTQPAQSGSAEHGPSAPAQESQSSVPASTPANAAAGQGTSAASPRTQLTQSLGRALMLGASNPLLRSMGAGLQLGGALAEHRLRAGTDPGHAGGPAPARPAAELEGAMRWSKQNMSNWPNDLFTLGRDNTQLMAGGLHQAFVNTGRATHMEDMLNVARGSYGAWRAQGEPGGLEAQRELFDAYLDQPNKNSPAAFIGAFQALAEKHNFRLDDSFASQAQSAFARSRDTGVGPRPGRDLTA